MRGLRRIAVLAMLTLHPGEIVSTDRLVDGVWGDSPPPTALNTVSHVWRGSMINGRDRRAWTGDGVAPAMVEMY